MLLLNYWAENWYYLLIVWHFSAHYLLFQWSLSGHMIVWSLFISKWVNFVQVSSYVTGTFWKHVLWIRGHSMPEYLAIPQTMIPSLCTLGASLSVKVCNIISFTTQMRQMPSGCVGNSTMALHHHQCSRWLISDQACTAISCDISSSRILSS